MSLRASSDRREAPRGPRDDAPAAAVHGTAQEVTDLTAVLRAVASRLDAILAEGTDAPSGDARRAAEAWSIAIGPARPAHPVDAELARRRALETTVLKLTPVHGVARIPSSGASSVAAGDGAGTHATAPHATTPHGRAGGIEVRLRDARERLAARRRAVVAASPTDARRGPRRERFLRIDRRVWRRLLLGAAIVAASAAVSLVLT